LAEVFRLFIRCCLLFGCCWCSCGIVGVAEWVLVDRIVLVVVVVVVPFVNLLRGPLFVQSGPSSLLILAAL
jgi:hypothetical protein